MLKLRLTEWYFHYAPRKEEQKYFVVFPDGKEFLVKNKETRDEALKLKKQYEEALKQYKERKENGEIYVFPWKPLLRSQKISIRRR